MEIGCETFYEYHCVYSFYKNVNKLKIEVKNDENHTIKIEKAISKMSCNRTPVVTKIFDSSRK